MADNPPSMTPLPTGTPPATQVSVPAASGGGPQTNVSTPGPGYPDWLLQFVRGAWVRYNITDKTDVKQIPDPSGAIDPKTKSVKLIDDPVTLPLRTGKAATGPTDAGPDGTRTGTVVRLYQLHYLFGQPQAIPGASGVNAVTFLLLVEAQKLLWQAMLDFLSAAVAAGINPSAQPLAPQQVPNTLGPSANVNGPSNNLITNGGGRLVPTGLVPDVDDEENRTTFSNTGAPGAQIALCVATMVQKNVSDVATYISTLSPSAQQTLLSEYCGVSEPVGGWHDSGYYAPHAGGGAFDLEYYGSPWIPLKGIDGIYHADAPTPANVAQAIIYDPCMAVWNRACNFAVGHNTTAGCQCYPVADTTSATLTTTTCDAIWELSDSVRTYFAQAMVPGINAQVDADRKTVAPGMVIGSSTYNAQTNTFSVSGRDMRALALGQPPHSSYPGSPGHYSGGVVGFNRVVVKKIHQASLANPPNPPYPASVPIANPPYPPPVNPKTTRLLQWSVFGFGSDLMHFDICHNPNQTVLPIAEVTNCQTFVEAFSTTSDGKNPWSAPGT